jgi:SnoaL-like domain
MDYWELVARESIRDLVARYNANVDSGRFSQVLELFSPSGVMDPNNGREYKGHDEILSIFTSAREAGSDESGQPTYLRHFTGTLQIDLENESSASSRCYYLVLTAIGLDHWGRYIDKFTVVDGEWRFLHRRTTMDGCAPGSILMNQ